MFRVAAAALLAWILFKLSLFLPDAAVITAFCRIPAFLAAAFLGIPVSGNPPVLQAAGLDLVVDRSCGAVLAFLLLSAMSAFWIRGRGWGEWLLWIPACWGIILLANTLRLIALVPLTQALIALDLMRFERLMHQTLGTVLFLSLPAFLAWRESTQE